MKVVTYCAALTLFSLSANGQVVHDNHKYENQSPNKWPDIPRGFSKVQEEAVRERQEQLVKFVNEFSPKSVIKPKSNMKATTITKLESNHRYHSLRPYGKQHKASPISRRPHRTTDEEGDDFVPRDHIGPGDVVGLQPSEMFKRPTSEPPIATEPVPSDSVIGESQIAPVYEESPWSSGQFEPDRIANHRFIAPHKPHNLYERPYGRVKVHTYRGRPKDYWVLPLDRKPEQKSYAQWGYYVKQPVGSEFDKFHSPLDLSFRYD